VLHAGWLGAAAALVFSLVAVALGVWLGTSGRGAGWALVLLFGLGAGVAAASLWSRGTLTLDQSGLQVTTLGRSTSYTWAEIEAISARQFRSRPFARTTTIVLTLRDGREVPLPDTYRRRPAALVSLLEAWRQASAAAAPPRP
jgi:hypothetical protein